MALISWPGSIAYTIDSSVSPTWQAHIRWAVGQIDDLIETDFTEVPLGPAPLAFVPWPAFMTLPGSGALAGADAGNLTYTSGGVGTASYIAADTEAWGPVTWLHELTHTFGTVDLPLTSGSASLMGYLDPDPIGMTADVVEFLQQLGADSGGNQIVLTGTTGGKRVMGGAGADTLLGSADAGDLLYGNQDDDLMDGAGGADTLYGGQGIDTASGGDGADVLYGNLEDDVLRGGDGADWLHGGQGNDTLYGGDGADSLYGGVGNDVIYADALDRVFGGAGADTVYGGSTWEDFDPLAGDVWLPASLRVGLIGVPASESYDPILGA